MRIGVLASGTGSNLQALLDTVHGPSGIRVAAVAADRADAAALERARRAGVAEASFPLGAYPDRATRDGEVADFLAEREVELVVLAGYMALLTPGFLARFPGRVINVHPALLPAFPGLDAIGQALAYGVGVTGVTVHFVDEGVDTGPVILQAAVEVAPGETRESLAERIHAAEHRLLPDAVRLFAAGRVRLDPDNPRRVLRGR